MVRQKQTAASDHCRKKRPLVAGADHDQAESISRTEFRVLIERDFAKTWCFFVALSLFPEIRILSGAELETLQIRNQRLRRMASSGSRP